MSRYHSLNTRSLIAIFNIRLQEQSRQSADVRFSVWGMEVKSLLCVRVERQYGDAYAHEGYNTLT